jgi:hypothetical protein
MGWPPRATIESTNHILVYGPSKPSSLSSTEAWIKPTASLVGLGEKLGTDPRIGQLVCCGLCREPFFSGVVGSVQICRRLTKGLLVGFSSAGCTSIRITVTLRYEYYLFVVVIT